MKAFSLASLKDLAPLQPDHPLLLLNFLHLHLDPLWPQIQIYLQILVFRQILPLRQKLFLFLKGLRLLLLLRFQFSLFQLLPLFQALFFSKYSLFLFCQADNSVILSSVGVFLLSSVIFSLTDIFLKQTIKIV